MILKKDSPIGIFDSGVGGLSVLKQLAILLPNENFIYFGDRKNIPYGTKQPNEVKKLSEKIVDFLLQQKVKIIVIACNTATAFAIQHLRKKYPFIDFVGMEPAIKPAAQTTQTGKIGVLATSLTLKGNHFNTTKKKYAQGIKVLEQAGTGLVEIVEQNQIGTDKSLTLLHNYITPMINEGIDKLVLGCTHYPFLTEDIKKIIGNKQVEIIDPAKAVASRTKYLLKQKDLLLSSHSKGYVTIYTNIPQTDTIQNLCTRMGASLNYQIKFYEI